MKVMTIKINRHADWVCVIFIVALSIGSHFLSIMGLVEDNKMIAYSGLFTSIKAAFVPGWNPGVIDPNVVYISQCLGHRAALDWCSGVVPWWNPFEGVGMPLAGEMQGAALFLPFVLLLYFSKGLLYLHIVLQSLAGIFTYLFLRHLKLSRIVATTGGALFALNGTFAWFGDAVANPIAFLPLLLLGIERTHSGAAQGKAPGWTFISLALAGSLYAGFPEVAYINGLFAAAWTLTRFCQNSGLAKVIFAKNIFTGLMIGLLLAAPILTAFLGYLPLADSGLHASGDFEHLTINSEYLAQIFLPYLFGPIFGFNVTYPPTTIGGLWSCAGGYLGACPLFPCLLSPLGRSNKALRLLLLGWIGFCFCKTFGFGPVVELANLLPLIKQTAFCRYCPSSWIFAAIVLVSFVLDDLRSYSHKRRTIIGSASLSLIVLSVIPVLVSNHWLTELVSNSNTSPWVFVSLAFALLLSATNGFIAAYIAQPKLRVSLISAILIIESFVLFIVPTFSSPRKATFKSGGVAFLKQHLGMNRFYTLGPIEPNLGTLFGLASINYNDMPVAKVWKDYVNSSLYPSRDPQFIGKDMKTRGGTGPVTQLKLNLNNYEWVGVKYIVAPPNISPFTEEPAVPRVKLVYSDEVMRIFELPSPGQYFEIIGSDHAPSLEVASRENLKAECANDCQLVRRELFFPGWKARVNGKDVPISQYKGLFQCIHLPKGNSQIEFTYMPPHMVPALVAFAAACLLIAFSMFRFLTEMLRPTNSTSPENTP